ncbi:MAG: phosphate ABC transporter substrate-binding protein PstS [Acidimicrobiales bacterium]
MTRLVRLAAILTTAALALSACGSNNNSKSTSPSTSGGGAGGSGTATSGPGPGGSDSATLSGAGSTFVQTIMQQWIKDYRGVAPGVTINYQGVGSGAGIQQLTAKTVDFAGSDVPLKASEQQATGGSGAVLEIPWTAGGVAIEYNLPGISDLVLSPGTLAGIFAGKITRWDAAAVKADNPSASLPSTGIQIVHRSDGSGTTDVFTSYLSAVVPATWTFGKGKDVPWPAGIGAKGSDGVTAAVKQTPGAIGYAEVSFPKQNGLGVALLKNKSGSSVGPTAEGVSAALAEATVKSDLTLDINFAPSNPRAYPLGTTTYLLYYKTSGNQAKATALKHFADWVLTEGQKRAAALDYAPMPQSILDRALAAVNGS